jgi:release factor glutamine methyltransferase
MSTRPASNDTEWTIGRLLSWTTAYFTEHGVDDPRLSAEVLLAHAAGWRRIDLYARFEQVLEDVPRKQFRELVKRAAAQEPIAYLVGEKEFFSLPLIVTRDVLIPRSETETLVECVIDHCAQAGLSSPRLIDLGTGSGCVAIAALKNIAGASAVATDVSPEAVEVARRNAERHGVLDRLTLVEADRLALPDDAVPDGGFDVLMSNPPYIAPEEMEGLDATVRKYEPRIALTDDQDGLTFYRSIAEEGARLLAADGVVAVEVADGRGAAVRELLEGSGRFAHRATRKDRVVGQERVQMFSLSPG